MEIQEVKQVAVEGEAPIDHFSPTQQQKYNQLKQELDVQHLDSEDPLPNQIHSKLQKRPRRSKQDRSPLQKRAPATARPKPIPNDFSFQQTKITNIELVDDALLQNVQNILCFPDRSDPNSPLHNHPLNNTMEINNSTYI